MAADMTDETIAQYMERIEKMSIKEIQKEIEFLESPGYNCEGLVCADGVITPRTKMHRKVLWYKRMNQKSLTALQWAKEGYVVNPDAIGRKWKNNPHNSKAIIYYVSCVNIPKPEAKRKTETGIKPMGRDKKERRYAT